MDEALSTVTETEPPSRVWLKRERAHAGDGTRTTAITISAIDPPIRIMALSIITYLQEETKRFSWNDGSPSSRYDVATITQHSRRMPDDLGLLVFEINSDPCVFE